MIVTIKQRFEAGKDLLQDFFKYPEVMKALDANKFDDVYDLWEMYYPHFKSSILTACLLYSEIDFLPYLTELPKYIFADLDLGHFMIQLPSSLQSIGPYCFLHSAVYAINIDMTYDQFQAIPKDEEWALGSMYVESNADAQVYFKDKVIPFRTLLDPKGSLYY